MGIAIEGMNTRDSSAGGNVNGQIVAEFGRRRLIPTASVGLRTAYNFIASASKEAVAGAIGDVVPGMRVAMPGPVNSYTKAAWLTATTVGSSVGFYGSYAGLAATVANKNSPNKDEQSKIIEENINKPNEIISNLNTAAKIAENLVNKNPTGLASTAIEQGISKAKDTIFAIGTVAFSAAAAASAASESKGEPDDSSFYNGFVGDRKLEVVAATVFDQAKHRKSVDEDKELKSNHNRKLGDSVNMMKLTATGGLAASHVVTAARTSSKYFDYDFTFTSTFSTSADPFIAGHASDIIVGGGMDIVVARGIEGRIHYFVRLKYNLLSF